MGGPDSLVASGFGLSTMRHVQQIIEGEWVVWNRKDRFQCCDCLMIHDVEFRVRNGKLELRMWRNNRSTAAYRRENKLKIHNGNHANGRRR